MSERSWGTAPFDIQLGESNAINKGLNDIHLRVVFRRVEAEPGDQGRDSLNRLSAAVLGVISRLPKVPAH